MMYKRLTDLQEELFTIRNEKVVKGKDIGWEWSMLPLTIKEGCTTYIGAPPASGKTELWFEFLINLSCLHGWNHVIFSPETGSASEIYAELCYKYIGKPYTIGENAMSQSEQIQAEMFINDHFIVIDPIDEDLSLDDFYKLVDHIEDEHEIRIHTTTIDPWNELTEIYEHSDLGREDKYLSRILGLARKNARKTNRHNCIINHVRDQAPINKDGNIFYPMATARDFAGGQVWFRKGLSVLIFWRPPQGVMGDDGVPYEDNEVHIKIAKSKPKGVSKNGIYKLYLDVDKYQYYMKDMFGQKIYAQRTKNKVEIKTNLYAKIYGKHE